MRIVVEEYGAGQIEAVRQFNDRLKAGGQMLSFPLSSTPTWLPKIAGRTLFQEYYLAADEGGAVRGGYILKHQDFWLRDRALSIADFQRPISEGAVDRHYSSVAVRLLRDAMARQPLLFGLGMGGYQEPVARLLHAAGWSMFTVPFFFRVIRPVTFLRNLTYLRRGTAMRYALDALALSGLGWLGIRSVQAFHRRVRLEPMIGVEVVDDLAGWADELWESCRSEYGFTAVRDAETVQILYPKQDPRFIRLKVSEWKRPIGYAILMNTPLMDHNYFGQMRLGSIVSCFGSTGDTATVVSAAAAFLQSQGVDLIVSNHSHAAWRRGFRQAGFMRGPSNFIFTSSPQLSHLLRQSGIGNDDLHFNRGDGDGPINL